jgi:hypothetical protein
MEPAMRSLSIVLALCGFHFFPSAGSIALAVDKPTGKAAEKPLKKPAAEPRVLRIVLKSMPDGNVREMIVDGKVIEPSKDGKKTRFNILHDKFVEIVFDAMGNRRAEEPEVEIDADDMLRYENIIKVVEAVSVRKGPKGEFQSLAKKVKFAPREGDDDPAFHLPKPVN